jgi:alkanesulfonate monooxygenase SsuD/methylene tetrahydromethanopterin reductase-like flavin-dependent oxidoreductase (luciferase family)
VGRSALARHAARLSAAVEFDLFYELAVPPFLGRTERQVFDDALAELALADRLGFRGAWLVEHHFMRGYSHSSKPDLFLAAVSQRTARLRLGLGIIPLAYHHPVHVAERIATLDVLSGGRVDVGIGRGFSPLEYATFGADMAASRAHVEEAFEVLRKSFAPGPLSHAGERFRYDALDLVPRVVQRPHPPLWTAAVSPDSFDWAAERGLGVLAGPFKPWFMTEQDIRRFRRAWRHAEPPRIGMTVGVLCLPDGARARKLAAPAFRWFYDELLRTTAPVLERLIPSYEHFRDLGRFRALARFGGHPKLLELAGMTVVGTPAQCVEKLARYREAGVTHMLLAIGAGAVDSGVVRESMHCLAEEVFPALRDAAPACASA